MTFNQSAVIGVFEELRSCGQRAGIFRRVMTHEPKSPPGTGMSLAIWLDSIDPVQSSGLAAVSARVTFLARIYTSLLAKDEDNLDPQLLTAVCAFMAALSEDFTLGGRAREVDLLGAEGQALSAQVAYTQLGEHTFRVADFTIPVVINDVFSEVP
jgi:hypothetical protein